MKTESQLQSELVKGLKKIGAEVLNLHGHGMQAVGWPDLYIVHWEWRGWLELKREGGSMSPRQEQRIIDLSNRGEIVYLTTIFERKYYDIQFQSYEGSELGWINRGIFQSARLSSSSEALKMFRYLKSLRV